MSSLFLFRLGFIPLPRNIRGKIYTDCNLIKKMLKQDFPSFSTLQLLFPTKFIDYTLWHIYLRQSQ